MICSCSSKANQHRTTWPAVWPLTHIENHFVLLLSHRLSMMTIFFFSLVIKSVFCQTWKISRNGWFQTLFLRNTKSQNFLVIKSEFSQYIGLLKIIDLLMIHWFCNPCLESRSERSFHLIFVVLSFITAGSGVEIIVGASFKPWIIELESSRSMLKTIKIIPISPL